MKRKPLTRDEDKAAWVLARLVPHPSNQSITLARFTRLGQAYERIHPRGHQAPTNHRPYGQRLGERALALFAR